MVILSQSLICIMVVINEYETDLQLRREKIITSTKKQFDMFRQKGVSLSDIENIDQLSDQEKRDLGILRIQIINNKLYVEHHVASIYPGSSKLACNNIIKRLDRILNTRKIKNVDFFFFFSIQIRRTSIAGRNSPAGASCAAHPRVCKVG